MCTRLLIEREMKCRKLSIRYVERALFVVLEPSVYALIPSWGRLNSIRDEAAKLGKNGSVFA